MSLRTNELPIVPMSADLKFVVDSATEDITGLASTDIFESKLSDRFLGADMNKGKELTETWAALSKRIKAGDTSNIHIGDWKKITIDTEDIIMEVAGVNTYYRCGDQEIKYHVDFISRDCMKTAVQMRAEAKNNGKSNDVKNPFMSSTLFDSINNTSNGILSKLPDDLKDLVIQKRALVEAKYNASSQVNASTGWDWKDMGKIWLPTEREVFGDSIWCEQTWSGGGGCNIQYPIFAGVKNSLIKHKGNGVEDAAVWWTASAATGSATEFVTVNNQGSSEKKAANAGEVYIPLCFRIG